MKINQNYLRLKDSYLFATIAERVRAFQAANPGREIIRLGIGDVTLPLVPAVTAALEKASREMGVQETFRGYDDSQGYDFFKQAVADYYQTKGVALSHAEIFISDGAKSDAGNILDLFSAENNVLIPDPVYPVYVDTNIMDGRPVSFLNATEENGFLPLPNNETPSDIVYLCSPNNPTGAAYDKAQLKAWVDYALARDAVILFDAAYEAFVRDDALPTSIFQIEGARHCAIEFCSLSKTAGFTGTRCGYTVVPKELKRDGAALNALWRRRQGTKFNGVGYIVQRAAQAVFSAEGRKQTQESIAYYRRNAEIIGAALERLGIWYCGGQNAPYLWLRCPNGMDSWGFFDHLLEKTGVVGTPGAGFGANGEGFFRLSSFGSRENVEKAMALLQELATSI